ncbi:MAG: adenylyltransferase/cytidyltransferase family protein [Anaerolineae bacterium]
MRTPDDPAGLTPPAADRVASRAGGAAICGAWRAAGERVVVTNGCFDLLHVGHAYLAAARALGDRLVVALNDDASVHALKGAGRPIVPASERAEVLAALRSVDLVTVFGGPTAVDVVAALRPRRLREGRRLRPGGEPAARSGRGRGRGGRRALRALRGGPLDPRDRGGDPTGGPR